MSKPAGCRDLRTIGVNFAGRLGLNLFEIRLLADVLGSDIFRFLDIGMPIRFKFEPNFIAVPTSSTGYNIELF